VGESIVTVFMITEGKGKGEQWRERVRRGKESGGGVRGCEDARVRGCEGASEGASEGARVAVELALEAEARR